MKRIVFLTVAVFMTYHMIAQTPKYLNPQVPIEERISDALSRMTLQEKMKVGYLKFFDLSGDLVGDYVPVLRVSDNRIGMFDKFTQTFYTSETASYTTQGNSACKYSLGNWS